MFAGVRETELEALYHQLQEQRYRPQAARGLRIRQANGKRRLIGLATVRDRIVQRFLLDELNPIVECLFSPLSYTYRRGYSAKMAVDDFMYAYTEPCWIVQTDIQSFFDSLSWPLLLTQIEQLPLIALEVRSWLQQHIKQDIRIDHQTLKRHQGVLQGSPLSGILANLSLNDFDWKCWEAGLTCFRYGDDLILLCGSEREAQQILDRIRNWLNDLYLTLNKSKTRIVGPKESFVYLGHRFQNVQCLGTTRDWHPYRSPKLVPHRIPKTQTHRSLLCNRIKRPVAAIKVPDNHYWSKNMTTLYITDQGARLRTKQQQFEVFRGQLLLCSVPVHLVSHVFLFGCCNVTHGAARMALQRHIPVVFLSQKGKYYGRLGFSGLAALDYLNQQVHLSQDPKKSLNLAKSIIYGKLHNSRILLQRLNRRRHRSAAKKAIHTLDSLMKLAQKCPSLEKLRGYEGFGAKVYFRGLDAVLMEPFSFNKRSIRPPKDPVNSLLSLGYSLLHQMIYSFVTGMGLHTHYGHLHSPRNNHPALVMDLMEEFRAPVVDSFVSYLINSQVIKVEDFTPPDQTGGVYLFPDALKVFLKHWEDRLHTQVTHPHTQYKVPYRRCLELQVREYIACLTNEQDYYRPMLWKV